MIIVPGSVKIPLEMSFFQAIFIACLLLSVSESKCCDNGWIAYDDSCYFIGRNVRTFDSALNYCRSIGGSLFVVDSTNEWETIKPHMVRALWSWIGLSIVESGYSPKWTVPSNFNTESLPWLIPTIGHGAAPIIQCVSYYSNPEPTIGYIHYYDCNLRHFFICERNSTLSK